MELLEARKISWLLPSRENAIIQTFPVWSWNILWSWARAFGNSIRSVEQLNDNWLCFINNLLFFSISHRVPRNEEWRKNLLLSEFFRSCALAQQIFSHGSTFSFSPLAFSIISTCGFKTNPHTYDEAYKMQIYCGWFIVRRPNKKW